MRNAKLAALALAALAAACGKSRPAPGPGDTVTVPDGKGGTVTVSIAACTKCHGTAGRAVTGGDPLIAAAPPLDAKGATTSAAVGAHLRHLGVGRVLSDAPIACSSCHQIPSSASTHSSQRVAFSGLAVNTWTTTDPKPQPAFAGGSCSATYCHGNFPGGAKAAPAWSAVGGAGCGTCHGAPPLFQRDGATAHPSNSACAGCHGAGYAITGITGAARATHMDGTFQPPAGASHPSGWAVTGGGPHATAVGDGGLGTCKTCHGANLDGVGGSGGVACGSCHGNAGAALSAPAFSCTGCHGGTLTGNDASGTGRAPAPPAAVRRTSPRPVGAHAVHVTAGTNGAIAPAATLTCAQCHATPGLLHADGQVTFAWGSVAAAGTAAPSFDQAANSCSATWCHGNIRNGNNLTMSWTGTAADAACGTCHGTPANPAPVNVAGSTHPAVGGALTGCFACHPESISATGAIIPGGKHLNGAYEFTGGGHPAGWVDPAQHGLAAKAHDTLYPRGLQDCLGCHVGFGAPPGGTSAQDCNACHTLAGNAGWLTDCTFCHGGRDSTSGAPPRTTLVVATATTVAQPTTDVRIGAHTSHVGTATSTGHGIAPPLDCADCHLKRFTTADPAIEPSHVDKAQADVTFAGSPGGGPGTYTAGSCSATYCHGNFAEGKGSAAVSWASPFPAFGCNNCHGQGTGAAALPPGPLSSTIHHPQNPTCGDCHTFATATHVDGLPNRPRTGCTSCHGDFAQNNVANTSVAAAPGVTAGRDSTGLTTGAVAGAHLRHLVGTSLRAAPIACSACHAVPPDGNVTHASGGGSGGARATLLFGGLAVTGGLSPGYAGSNTGTGGATAGSCSATYCHGGGRLSGAAYVGTNQAPSWTAGAAAAACGTCHKAPPTSAAHAGVTPTSDCGACHTGYGVPPALNLASHMNGSLDVINLSCTSCHGDAARTAVATAGVLDALGGVLVRAAPPRDASGASPGQAGVHLAHVNQGATGAALSNALACALCHTVPTSASHSNGTVQVAFTGLAAASGASFNASANTCASTYCHGNFTGGSNATPNWTVAGKLSCTACHGSPPGPVSATNHHPQNPNCGSCHAGATSTTLNAAAVAVHVNGTVNRSPNASGCTGCHGDLTASGVANTDVRAAPGSNANAVDTKGNAAATFAGVGAHAAHLLTPTLRSAAIACNECHVVPATNDVTHASSAAATLTFGTLARTGPITPGYAGGSCSSVYCHGASLAAGGSNVAPVWLGGAAQAACGTCHQAPPPSHASFAPPVTAASNCGACHTGYGVPPALNLANHINGQLDVAGGGESAGGSSCGGCHAAIFSAMTGAAASKHLLGGGDVPTDSGGSWVTSATLKASPNYASASCVSMCHGDHPHDLTSPVVTTHENNLYADPSTQATRASGTATRTATNRASTDFDSAASNGMCVRCHSIPIAAGGATISGATFGASAHDFTAAAGVTWEYALHDGSKFRRNCTKCHASQAEGTTPSFNGTGLTAVHSNANADLLSGLKNPGTTAASFICYNCHGSAATPAAGAQGNRSAKDVQTRVGTGSATYFNHPASGGAGGLGTAHDTALEAGATWNSGRFSGANRHANCLDCHGPHAAGPTKVVRTATATATRNAIPAGSPLLGATGVTFGPTYPTLVTTACAAGIDVPSACVMQTTAANFGASPTPATLEYQICFKCHTSFAFGTIYPTAPATGASGLKQTDLASEFSPTNRSGHPVVTGLNSYSNNGTVKGLAAVQLLAPWNVNVGTQTMLCTDCHNTDAASPAAQGPHGSAVRFMLAGTNKAWPYTVAGATSGTLFRVNTSETGINTRDGLFCRNCHPPMNETGTPVNTNSLHVFANTSSHSGADAFPSCVACHIRVPHGGKVSRLILTANAPARYKTSGQNVTMSAFTKGARTSYARNVGWTSNGCSHSSNGTESW